MKRLPLVALLGLAACLILASCSNDAESTPTPVQSVSSPTQTPASDDAMPSSSEPATATAQPSAMMTEQATMPKPSTSTATLPPTSTSESAELDEISIQLNDIASGLDGPTGMAVPGDGSGRLFILEQKGRIQIVTGDAILDTPFLDLTDRVGSDGNEQGLLGLAFHPDYPENGTFFVDYTNTEGDTVISKFQVTDDPNRADPASEAMILSLEQPAANHNGGNLVFGPDGYLYIGTGDGGAAGDRFENAQNGQTLLGAMLRIDVDGAEPYAIPPDNPFVGNPDVRDEIWAIGLRNPWRYAFDRQTTDLYIADVGQGRWEEVDVQPADSTGGENYGWSIMEGNHCYQSESCATEGLTQPVAEYSHAGGGCSITGGYVYRGQAYPTLDGIYFYADYCSGKLWGLRWESGNTQVRELMQDSSAIFTSFGQDEQGEVYIIDAGAGSLRQIVVQ